MDLITPFEVLKYSPAGFDYPTSSFCELIPQIEQEFTRECLGDDLYEYLVAKLAPYPSVNEYDPNVTYSLDDLVIRNGCVFKSTANTNTTDPIEPNSDWTSFERFTDAGANELWTKYLRFILALKVYQSSLIFTTYRAGAGGLTVNQGDGSGTRSATKNELTQVAGHLDGQTKRAVENMVQWLKDNAETKGLPLSSCLGQCETKTRSSRRFAWRY